jgi:hypothetical protein
MRMARREPHCCMTMDLLVPTVSRLPGFGQRVTGCFAGSVVSLSAARQSETPNPWPPGVHKCRKPVPARRGGVFCMKRAMPHGRLPR